MRWTPMEPGERDWIVRIEGRPATDTPDVDSGEPTETWTTLVPNMPAYRATLQGTERFRADQLSARSDARWEINYRLDMDPDLVDVPKVRRLVCQGRTHDIVSAAVIGRREGIELFTLAKVG